MAGLLVAPQAVPRPAGRDAAEPVKLTGKRIETFLKAPAADVAAVLVFGPEPSLIHERVAALVAAVAGVPADPFRCIELPAPAVA